ncbi:MAG: outer membrane lipoprotein chaperone LolA [Gammaproteobacteria bacterium]|nr:outer membrane lipoprotein chaperone LolA [Gammaproteobacteria bacterium]
MRHSSIIVLLTCFILASTQSFAQSTEEKLYQSIKTLSSLKANFFQQVVDSEGEVIQEAKGIFELKKPGRFRWHYDPPYSQQIIADGKNLWLFDLELAQATVQPIEQALGSAPIILLTDLKPLSDEFEIRDMPESFGLEWVALAPKIQDTEFYRVDIGLDGNVIREMRLHDHFDQKTIIRFSDIDTVANLPDSRFIFSIPDGVDVIGTAR